MLPAGGRDTAFGVRMTALSPRLTAALAFSALLGACGGEERGAGEPLLTELAPAGGVGAAETFIDPAGAEIGHIVMSDGPRGVLIRIDMKGLDQGWHAIHIHETGDCSDGADGFQASGGHINPDDHAHGLLNADGPERADLTNIYAGADGRATAELYRGGVALYPSEADAAVMGPYPLFDDDGFAVIVHENADDHRTQPIGGAAARVACAAFNS